MSILKYVKGIPTFKKSSLLDRLSVISVNANDLKGNIGRMEANKIDLEKEINSWAITKSIVRELAGSPYRGLTFNFAMDHSLATVVSLCENLGKLVSKDRHEVWDGKLLNLRQANILNLLEHVDHFLKYTTFVYDVLITQKNKKARDADSYLQKADARFLAQTLDFYKGTLMFLLKGSVQIIKDLEKIPEIDVDETSLAVMEGTSDKGHMELVKNGFGVHNLNPVFWWKLGRMNMHVAEVDKARNENDTFAMKISQANNLRNGTNDATLDEQILVYQDEIIKNVARINAIEAQYA